MKNAYTFLIFCFLSCAYAFSQDVGTIQCGANMKNIPAWTAPGSAYVVEQLSCGQFISIIGLEKGYFKIQLGNRIAYVYAKYVKLPQSLQQESILQPGVTLESRSRQAQSNSPESDLAVAEIYGGYSYLNFDTNELLISREHAHGWEASISGNFNEWFAVEFDVSGHYKSYGAVSYRDYSFLAGPRINFKPGFIHVLLGGDRLSAGVYGISAYQTGAYSGEDGHSIRWKLATPGAKRRWIGYILTQVANIGQDKQYRYTDSSSFPFYYRPLLAQTLSE